MGMRPEIQQHLQSELLNKIDENCCWSYTYSLRAYMVVCWDLCSSYVMTLFNGWHGY